MVDARVRHLFRCQRNGLLPDGLHGHVELALEHHLHVVFNDVRLNRTTTSEKNFRKSFNISSRFYDAYLPNDNNVEVELTARLQQVGEVRGRLRSGSSGALTLAAEQRPRRRRRRRCLPPFGVGAPAAQEVEISAGRRGADDLHTQAARR